jgi:hypothetical protein
MSDITVHLLNQMDYQQIRNKRIENASVLTKGLKKMGVNVLMDFNKCQVPLFVPISIQKRDVLRKLLRKNNVFCPVHWPRCVETASLNQRLYETELSLVIDQRYDKKDMTKILNLIIDFRNGTR